ncbi:MAG TPA: membrane protein insertase YidC [Gemmatimonadaceae bacterium]|nr:membrane protein insertase YidC [Gemmatimonadaceae bacterium]
MEKRYFLALLLAAAVVAITQFLFPVAPPAPPVDVKRDTVSSVVPPRARVQDSLPSASEQPRPAATDSVGLMDIRPEITTIETRRSIYQFSSIGAAPTSIRLKDYKNLTSSGGIVELRTPGEPLLKYGLVHRGDTTSLDRVPFRVTREGDLASGGALIYSATVDNFNVTIRYGFVPDRYMVSINGRIDGPAENVYLLTHLPSTVRPTESDTTADLNSLAYSFKPQRDNARLVQFGSLDPGEQELAAGPLTWAAVKNKYFVLGVLNPPGNTFDEVSLKGGPRTSKLATTASATIVKAIKDGKFTMDLYAGPQQQNELVAVGRDFDHVNPFGWRFLQGMVQPIATLCVRLLLWMHEVLQLSYGWVLVIFGVLIRIILWPLNQSAMRSSMKMQDIQPQLAEVQKKYKDKPERQREEIMKVYKEHGASPFTALTGCLPALIPMPVLFALFFVFQGTIEFRGVPFMWLHDISMKDPYYILPVLMGASMYVLSWIGLRNAPPNPQAKMMSYMFPVMMTFVLANMASGLNLYYTAQNLAALPQQWLLARERARRKRLT